MSLSVLQNYSKVIKEPFPHVIIENCLPDKAYNELEATFPLEEIIASPIGANNTWLRPIRHMNVPNIWKEFSAENTSQEFFWRVLDIFNVGLPGGSVGLRRDVISDYTTDCQFVIQRPVTGTTRTPHLDNPVEIYAALLYMRPHDDICDGGDFVIRSGNGRLFGKREVADTAPFKILPYARNTLVMFANVRNSYHSVNPRYEPKHFRRSINIIGEFFEGSGKKMWEES